MAEEALNSFTSVLESIPDWIAELEDLSQKAVASLNQILSTYPSAVSELQPSKRPSKSVSCRSKNSKDIKPSAEKETAQDFIPPPEVNHLTNSDALRLSQRKRKTASVCSGGHSGPPKFRSRRTTVLYYDGEMQNGLEKLVRAVGTSRNTLRKAKMGAKVDALSRASSSSSADSSSGEDFSDMIANIRYATSRSVRIPLTYPGDNVVEAFDRVDNRLEQAQSLSERAAHQLLRDGDCLLEITNAKNQLVEALEMVRAEIPTLQQRAEKAAKQRKRCEGRKMRAAEAVLTEKMNSLSPMVIPANGKLEPDDLEIDDNSDGDDDEYNLDTIPLGSFAQIRSSRMAARY